MEDRFLFRGKDLTGTWRYGSLYATDTDSFIIDSLTSYPDGFIQAFGESVEPETVGQCTGLKDKNGKLIFEGDIVSGGSVFSDSTYLVEYSEHFQRLHLFPLKNIPEHLQGYKVMGVHIFDWIYPKMMLSIIGNVFDNPELIKGDK